MGSAHSLRKGRLINHQHTRMKKTDPATKRDLDQVAMATFQAISETEGNLKTEIQETVAASERRVLDAIDRLEKLYDVDRRLRAVEKKVGISAQAHTCAPSRSGPH